MLLVCVYYWVLVALWMYRNAAQCKLSPLYWGLIGLFTSLIGLIVYKIYKHSAALCPACGAAQSAGHPYTAPIAAARWAQRTASATIAATRSNKFIASAPFFRGAGFWPQLFPQKYV